MSNRIGLFVWHPFLVGIFPIVFLYSRNVTEMRLPEILLPLALVIASVLVLSTLLFPVVRDRYRRGILLSFFLALFFSYGPLVEFFWGLLSRSEDQRGTAEIATLIALASLILAAAVLLRRTRRDLSKFSRLLSQVMALLVLIQIGVAGFALAGRGVAPSATTEETTFLKAENTPDIYLIVLDGYARADILREIYGADNSEFRQALEARGFYVADSARSNYVSTAQSLTSELNMNYLHHFLEAGRHEFSRMPTARMLNQNRVMSFLRKYGYKTVAFATGYAPTEMEKADYYLEPAWTLSEFQNHLLNSTPIPLLMEPFVSQFDLHRRRIEFMLDKLTRLENIPSPRLVYSHFSCPHPPFVYDAEGNPTDRDWPFSFSDGDHYFNAGGTKQQYVNGYAAQVRFISERIVSVIDRIIGSSNDPPVILLQADHGPGSGLHWESLSETNLHERFSILSSYYLPGADTTVLYESISPVNSFRVVLNEYFGTEYPLLTDSCYFTTWIEPYNFIDVTSVVRSTSDD